MRLVLMGRFALDADDGPVELPLSAQRLVAFLALARRPVARLYIAGHLWEEAGDKRAGASLRSALWRTQQRHPLVLTTPRELELGPQVAVDATQALALARRVADPAVDVPPDLVVALCRT